MSLLESLINRTTPAPPKVIIFGQPGAGKTTFAASAGAILLDCENGAGAVPGLKRTPYLKTWPEMRKWLVELSTSRPDGCGVVAVDTVDWMVQRICEYVVMDLDTSKEAKARDVTNTLGTAHGGYFKAREIVQNIVYRDLLPMLNAIADHGMAIILLAHAANIEMTTPEGFDMRLAAPDLPRWIAPPFIEWADAVMYASKDSGGRHLITEGSNLILAKNRYSMPARIGLTWADVSQAITANRKDSTHGNA